MNQSLAEVIEASVMSALLEDVGSGDITAQLIDETKQAKARVITRDKAVICGTAWVDAVFTQLDPSLSLNWRARDGDILEAGDIIFTIEGNARAILTGERAALNFLQTLSGTATLAKQYADLVAHTEVKLLDTRKTMPRTKICS